MASFYLKVMYPLRLIWARVFMLGISSGLRKSPAVAMGMASVQRDRGPVKMIHKFSSPLLRLGCGE